MDAETPQGGAKDHTQDDMRARMASSPDALARAEPAPPCTMVIFGAAGDLTKRLLMPSLYNLRRAGLLVDGFSVIAVDHNERSEDDYRQYLTDAMHAFIGSGGEFSPKKLDEDAWGWIRDRLFYHLGDFDKAEDFAALKGKLDEAHAKAGHGNALFYLAVAPRFFGGIAERLSDAGLMAEADDSFRRLVVEKPFGDDLKTAQDLNGRILAKMAEKQVYRIDHFLGKETVQNIMALRFANGLFEPLWNREHIDHVQITAAETVGVEGRGKFYEAVGALRDMMPNHLFQLLSLVAMEPPTSFDADDVRGEKAKVLKAIKPLDDAHVQRDAVRGQYTAGHMGGGGGKDVAGYRDEPDVAKDSGTETFIALRYKIDNWRWAGVPFYLRTGKHMATRRTEIAVQFKQAPYAMFRDTPVDKLTPNVMVLHIQPNEGITLNISAKKPGPKMELGRVGLDFHYGDYFDLPSSTGYETLLYDVMIGDPTLFQRADMVEAGWAAVQPVLDATAAGKTELHLYPSGSSGPDAAVAMLAREGRHWLPLTE